MATLFAVASLNQARAVEDASPPVNATQVVPDSVATGLMPVPIYRFAIHNLSFSPDGTTLAAGDGMGAVRLWNVKTGELRQTLPAHGNWAFSIAWFPDGTRLATAGGDNFIQIFSLTNLPVPLRTLAAHSNDVHAVALTTDGGKIISAGDDRSIRTWDSATGRLMNTLTGHQAPVTSIAISPDNQWIASGSRDDTARLWDLKSGAWIRTFASHADDVMSVKFSPDGRRLATASYDGTIHLSNIADGRTEQILKGHSNRVFSVAFSPNGRGLASAGDATLRLWNLASGQPWKILKFGGSIESPQGRIAENISAVAYSPDGSLVAAGSTCGMIYLVAPDSGKLVRKLKVRPRFESQVTPEKYSQVHKTVMNVSSPKWPEALLRLAEMGDGFTIEFLEKLSTRTILPEQSVALTNTLSFLRQAVPVEETSYFTNTLHSKLERAAYADLTCNPLESTLVPWTMKTIRANIHRPEVVQELRRIEALPVKSDDKTGFGFVGERVRVYVKRLLD
ncbi:MAG: WD40 repeat domain-containing protein [Verrucomicrobiota bacterium]